MRSTLSTSAVVHRRRGCSPLGRGLLSDTLLLSLAGGRGPRRPGVEDTRRPVHPLTMLDTAVIPCGGLGTRLHPISRWLPKECCRWRCARCSTGPSTKPPTPGSCASSWSPTRTSRCSRRSPGATPVRSSSSSCPRIIRAAWATRLLRARDHLSGSAFAVILPDNLFLGPNPTAAVLAVHRATGLATVLLAEISQRAGGDEGRHRPRHGGAVGRRELPRRRDRGQGEGPVRRRSEAQRSPRSAGWCCRPAASSASRRRSGSCPPGAELDDVPVFQQLAREGALAGALAEARFFDVGVPEGYREAVTAFPAAMP